MVQFITVLCFLRGIVDKVIFTKNAEKDLKKLPPHILNSFSAWVFSIENIGLQETRKIKGYNDEALKGSRKHQRSARLNYAYRVIYVVEADGEINIIQVEEVNKHKY